MGLVMGGFSSLSLSERCHIPSEYGVVVIGLAQEFLELERRLPLQERREAVDGAVPETFPHEFPARAEPRCVIGQHYRANPTNPVQQRRRKPSLIYSVARLCGPYSSVTITVGGRSE